MAAVTGAVGQQSPQPATWLETWHVLLEGDLPRAPCPLGDERWQRRVSEVPPPEPQDVLAGSSGMLLCPTDREEDVCRQQKGVFFSPFKEG